MAHSIFGWSYPPGCSGPPDDDEGPCEVCGQWPVEDECICPECPECGAFGDPDCYINHGLRRTEEQKFLMEIRDREVIAMLESERRYDEAINWPEEIFNNPPKATCQLGATEKDCIFAKNKECSFECLKS